MFSFIYISKCRISALNFLLSCFLCNFVQILRIFWLVLLCTPHFSKLSTSTNPPSLFVHVSYAISYCLLATCKNKYIWITTFPIIILNGYMEKFSSMDIYYRIIKPIWAYWMSYHEENYTFHLLLTSLGDRAIKIKYFVTFSHWLHYNYDCTRSALEYCICIRDRC